MFEQEIFEKQIPNQVRKKLQQNGITFSELRNASHTPEKLVGEIYCHWRSGSLYIDRNWNGMFNQPRKIPYSDSSCLLPDDRIYIDNSTEKKLWKAATWNVNSIRTRLPLLLEWLEKHNPDAVCLQETKVADSLFPVFELKQAGYESAYYGQKSYNGVAILAKHTIKDIKIGFHNGYDLENARLIAGTVSGVRIINVYVPQGQTTESEKFKYKLEFFSELMQEIQYQKNQDNAFAIMGDFNVAPEAKDLSDPESMLNKVSFHPKEHEILSKIKDTGLIDVFRKFDQQSGQFSWWDFRTRGFERGEGMRIDYILGNSVLTSSCQACIIDTEAREKDRPSDHAPVIAEFLI